MQPLISGVFDFLTRPDIHRYNGKKGQMQWNKTRLLQDAQAVDVSDVQLRMEALVMVHGNFHNIYLSGSTARESRPGKLKDFL